LQRRREKGAGIAARPPACVVHFGPRPVDIPDIPNYGSDAYCDMGAYENQQAP